MIHTFFMRLHLWLCRHGIHAPGTYIELGSFKDPTRFVTLCRYCGEASE